MLSAEVRDRFPALGRQVGGVPAVYLDGAGGSQVPESVLSAVASYLTNDNGNTGGAFATSIATDHLLAEARDAAADLLGAGPGEVVFGQNTTTINFLLVHALARTMEPGAEIVVTELDHDGNVAPWLMAAADRDLIVRTAKLRVSDGTLDVESLEEALSSRTAVVACTLASNALGSITDIGRVAELTHHAGALLWVDGVHMAPHGRVNRKGLGADVLLTSAYKYFGPHLGVAAIREDLALALPADRVRPADEFPPGHRFETGTLAHEAIAGFVAAVGYLESLGDGADRAARLDDAFTRIEAYENTLTRYTLERLAEIPACTLYGIREPGRVRERTPTFCFNLEGWTPRELSEELGQRGIFTYDGDYYALGVMTAFGLDRQGGAVRAGYLHYTTPEEAERFCDTIAALAEGRRQGPFPESRA